MSYKYIHSWMVLLASMLLAAPALSAITLNEAKEMYQAGDFEGALPVFLEEIKKKPKDASLNQWLGVCLMQAGRTEEAIPRLKFAQTKGVTEASRYLAEIAFQEYDFEGAEKYIDQYETALKRARKSMPDEISDLRRRVLLAENMLERVEKIVIIDSIAVDRDDFFKAYKLSPGSGSISSPDILPEGFEHADPTAVAMPETQTMMFWAAPSEDDEYCIVESNKLFDGSWEKPAALDETINIEGDNNFPFLMADGVTLYYANNGEGSIGGYDIFISRKEDNSYLQPQNIGMPYNSPYDDYLLAIDEVTGVGWWATDRNGLGDMITIYKFIPSDLRQNYDSDDEDLTDKARITDYRSTWESGKNYADLLKKIDKINLDKKTDRSEFEFALPGGRVYTRMSDFRSARARAMMEDYMAAVNSLKADEASLARLRQKYRNGDRSATEAIKNLELKIENDRKALKTKANEIISQEN
ncbi:MAG: hypothetical protein HDS29_03690 [Bacteroides sp.]|nr:hypothetical protein [Bacteroides sp.]